MESFDIFPFFILLGLFIIPFLPTSFNRKEEVETHSVGGAPPVSVEDDDPGMVWREIAKTASVQAGTPCTCPVVRKPEAQLFSENYRARLKAVNEGLADPGDTAKEYTRRIDPRCEVHRWDFEGE